MSIANATANFGLSATGTATRPNTSGSIIVGQSSASLSLSNSTSAFHARLYLQDSGNDATLNTNNFAVAIDSNAAVAATGTLTLVGQPVAAQTVTIGSTVYTFRATVPAAFDVLIGATASDSLDNLIAAINLSAGAGTLYGTGTTAHPTVGAAAGTGDTVDLTADTAGEAGNAIATTETLTNGSFGAATLTGGAEANEWEGAASDYQGDAFGTNTAIHGLLVYCVSGKVKVSNSTSLVIPVTAGAKALISCQTAISELLATLTFLAEANDTEVYITCFGVV
jgi:hypothetical protein